MGARSRGRFISKRAAPVAALIAAVAASAGILVACAAAPKPAVAAPGPEAEPARPRAEAAKPAVPSDSKKDKDARGSAGDAMSFELAPAPSVAAAAAPASGERGKAAFSGAAAPAASASAPFQSGLKAGYSDDNEQFNYFVDFLDRYKATPHYDLKIQERIIIRVLDAADRPVMNARVTVKSGARTLASGRTYADGSFALYPLESADASATAYLVEAQAPEGAAAGTARVEVERSGPRTLVLRLGVQRSVPAPLPVDVLFILDTTGSMGEEIERLRSTIEIIDANIVALKPKPELRFGMVLYKDKGDSYDTRVVPFTADLEAFRAALGEIGADGGGDDPEDLQAALDKAVRSMKWNADGIRLGFAITDAAAHLDYGQKYSYAHAARDAKAAGIKLFSIGVGGLPLEGEYVLRQVAQYTQGRYIFLTYGEKGESEGGTEGAVSHHTGSNYSTDKLESIVIRFVKEEIARQSDRALEYDESYYAARKVDDQSREDTLGSLFSRALKDLSDYSSLRIGEKTRCAVMPISAADGAAPLAAPLAAALARQAEYFGAQLALSASSSKLFTVVERKDLQKVMDELELQLSALGDEESAARVGKVLGAEVLVTGAVYEKEGFYELYLKLVRVETAEVLSATKARIDRDLGL
jgi:hypothetical protein